MYLNKRPKRKSESACPQANAAAFEACCKERIHPFDDAEDEEDIWEEKETNYATQAKSRTRWTLWCFVVLYFYITHMRPFSELLSLVFSRFGVSQSSAGSSRSSMENGGREGDRGSESDEENDSQKNTSDPGRPENSRESRQAAMSSSKLAHV